VTAGETLVADGQVSVTVHWLPPLESDLPITRYKVSDGMKHNWHRPMATAVKFDLMKIEIQKTAEKGLA